MNYLLLMWAIDETSGGTEADYQAWTTYEQELKDAGVFVAGAASQLYAAAARYVRPLTSKLPDQSTAPSVGQELQIAGYYPARLRQRGRRFVGATEDAHVRPR